MEYLEHRVRQDLGVIGETNKGATE